MIGAQARTRAPVGRAAKVDDLVGWAVTLRDRASEPRDEPLRICSVCIGALGVTGGGISLVSSVGHRGVVCATDVVAARIEDIQLTLGEGPCVAAVRDGVPVLVDDVEHPSAAISDRWPAFVEGAAEAGARAVFAFPLSVGPVKVGALDLYRADPGPLSPDELTGALLAADAAALAVIHLDATDDTTFVDDPGARSSYQLQVHQATGMIMVQARVTIDDALLLLRARAFSSDRPLVAVARDVVERRLRFGGEGS